MQIELLLLIASEEFFDSGYEPGNCGEKLAVVYGLTKRSQEKLFADWEQQYKAFFVPNQEPAFA